MGVQIGKDGARDVISVSLADDLEEVTAQWCASRNVSEKARVKVISALRTRLDEALAKAYQDQEHEQQEAAAAARLTGGDNGIC